MDNEKILDKVAKLLKLAEGSKSEHEAATAMANAQRILTEHRLSMADVKELDGVAAEPIEVADEPLYTAKKIAGWKEQVAVAVSKANGCRIFFWRSKGKITQGPKRSYTTFNKDIKIVGRASDVAIVRHVFEFLCAEIDRQHGIAKAAGRINGGKSAGSAFRLGAADVVCERMKAEHQAVKAEAVEAGQTAAIVLLDSADAEVEEFYSTLDLKPGKRKNYHVNDYEAYSRGSDAGKSIQVRPAMNEGKEAAQLAS